MLSAASCPEFEINSQARGLPATGARKTGECLATILLPKSVAIRSTGARPAMSIVSCGARSLPTQYDGAELVARKAPRSGGAKTAGYTGCQASGVF